MARGRHRLPEATSGPKPIAALGDVALEARFEHVPQRGFHGPVAHRRKAQRTLFGRAGFGDPNAPGRWTAVALGSQFFPPPGPLGRGVFVALLHGLALGSRGAAVAPDRLEAGLQIAPGQQLVPESKPNGCRLAGFEPGEPPLRPHRRFHPPPTVADGCGVFRRGRTQADALKNWCRQQTFSTVRPRRHRGTATAPAQPCAGRGRPGPSGRAPTNGLHPTRGNAGSHQGFPNPRPADSQAGLRRASPAPAPRPPFPNQMNQPCRSRRDCASWSCTLAR